MLGKKKKRIFSKFFLFTFSIWIFFYANKLPTFCEPLKEESRKNSQSYVTIGTTLGPEAKRKYKPKYESLKERIIEIVNEDDGNFEKRFNLLMRDGMFREQFNELTKNDNFRNLHNQFNFYTDLEKSNESFGYTTKFEKKNLSSSFYDNLKRENGTLNESNRYEYVDDSLEENDVCEYVVEEVQSEDDSEEHNNLNYLDDVKKRFDSIKRDCNFAYTLVPSKHENLQDVSRKLSKCFHFTNKGALFSQGEYANKSLTVMHNRDFCAFTFYPNTGGGKL
ncbi:Plasmodium exported protein, unknown function [Plasmodium ovale wallikeri]|uniref:Uncharacterized protein n=1 Tax=Plasmodium ovale wallikeri TaxID=864142 RepID=A0A1A9ADC5_PLAOA|nr:Plasmodium exported protein, unknown function [Plasmodium ovale wallikeri]SBT56158.1 Plasmodium exported protein, unknown function [Plasmodium ovale wallikeri]